MSFHPDPSCLLLPPSRSSAHSLLHFLEEWLVAGQMECSLQAGTIWLQLCSHYRDNFCHFIWETSAGMREESTETIFYEKLVNSPSLWCRISWFYGLAYPFFSLCWTYLLLETKQKVTDVLNSYNPLFVFNMVQARSYVNQI
jgi:hypothetical protein